MASYDVEHPPKGAKIDLYIKDDCPYCAQAMAYYSRKKIAYTAHDAQKYRDEREAMFTYSGDDPTVPAIVINGEYVQSGWGKPPRG